MTCICVHAYHDDDNMTHGTSPMFINMLLLLLLKFFPSRVIVVELLSNGAEIGEN